MADYIEHSYTANPRDGPSLISQGREYIVDSVVTSVTYTAHLQDALELILEGQEASIDKMSTQLEAVSMRAAAVKYADGLAHLKEQLNSAPTWSGRVPAPAGEDPKMFVDLPPTEIPPHIREACDYHVPQTGDRGMSEGICYDLSSLDKVGRCMASEEDRLQDNTARLARQVRRPTILAAGTSSSPAPAQLLKLLLSAG